MSRDPEGMTAPIVDNSRSRGDRFALWATVALLAVLSVVSVHNAFAYSSIGGFDASEHIRYAHLLVDQWRIPERGEIGSYYTPPGYFVLAGGATRLGVKLGMSEPEHLGQLVNALLSIGTALVLLGIVALLFPGRPVLRVLALGAYVTVPVALKSNAMFHPQPLAMFLATLAVFLTTRLVQRGSYGWWLTIALGVVVGAGQLVRSAGLWAFGVAVLALLGAAIARPDTRRRAIRSLVVVFGVGLLVPLPWYLYLNSNYGNPIFGRSSNAIAPTQSVLPGRPQIQPASIVPPIALARPLSYYLGSGLPETITDPHRGVLEPQFLPILYAETWGDYFGIWSWGAGTPRPEMSPSLNRRLVVQSVVGIVPTFVAIAGFLALLALALSRMCEKAELLAVALMPLAAFAAVAYYASKYVSPDGDTIKALFILPAIPCLAICLGFLGDAIFARWRVAGWVLIGLLTLSGLVSLTFGIA